MKLTEAVASLTQTTKAQGEILVPVLAFLVPLLVAGPQWLTGTLVNCLLILASLTLSGRALALIIVLPSLGALAHGALFGPFTPFLAFFLPVIWVGNFLFVRSFTFLRQSIPSFVSVVLSAVLKALLLYAAALFYVQLHWVPAPFLISMGIIQFVTALAGGWMAVGIFGTTCSHD